MADSPAHRHAGLLALTRDVAALPVGNPATGNPPADAAPGTASVTAPAATAQAITAGLTDALLGSARRALLTADGILYGTPATRAEAEFLETFGRHLTASLADLRAAVTDLTLQTAPGRAGSRD